MRGIGRIGDMRSCGAVLMSTYNTSVFSSNRLVATLYTLDSHGGHAITFNSSIFAENLPVTLLGDTNDICSWIWPPHFSQPLVTASPDEFGE